MNEPRRASLFVVVTAGLLIIVCCIILFTGTAHTNSVPVLWSVGLLAAIVVVSALPVRRRIKTWFAAIVGGGLVSAWAIFFVWLFYVTYLSFFQMLGVSTAAVDTLAPIASGTEAVVNATVNGAQTLLRAVLKLFLP